MTPRTLRRRLAPRRSRDTSKRIPGVLAPLPFRGGAGGEGDPTTTLAVDLLLSLRGKLLSAHEQCGQQQNWIDEIGQIRRPIGDAVGHGVESGKDIAQKEANDRIEDHCPRYQ